MSETPFSPVRRALLRGGLFGAGFAPTALLTFSLADGGSLPASRETALAFVLIALGAGATATGAYVLERLVARLPASRPVDVAAGAGAWLVATGLLLAAVVQVTWSVTVIQSRSFATATDLTWSRLERLRDPELLALYGAMATPFGPSTVLRARAVSCATQLVFVPVGAVALAVPLVGAAGTESNRWFFLVLVVGGGLLLPLASAGADAVEIAILRRLEAGS